MERKYKISLTIFSAVGAAWLVYVTVPWLKSHKTESVNAASVVAGSPVAGARVTPNGTLLSMANPDREISRLKDRKAGRSPAFDKDATREENLDHLIKEFLEKGNLSSEYDKLGEYFPDGKGVNRMIRLSILLSSRPAEGEDGFSELALATRVQAELNANAEAALVSLDQGLGKMPREMNSEKMAALRTLSQLGYSNPSLRNEVKTAFMSEARRAKTQAEGALVFATLLRVDSSKAWFKDVSSSFEKLHPGSELSDFVAVNVVAL